MNYHKLSADSSFIAVISNRDKRKLILQYLSNLIIKFLFVAAARIRNTPVSKLREELCAAWRDHTGCQGRWAALRFCIVIKQLIHLFLLIYLKALCAGKVGSEDDVKEEFKEESDPPATHEEGSLLLHSLF